MDPRDDRAVGPATRLVVVTEGVLTARLVDDPALTDVGLVIFDEFHERSVPGDVGLALMLAGVQTGEHDARLLLMSATIDADIIAAHLDDAPVVSSPGRTYPIELVWRPKKRREPLAPAVVRAVREALRGPGDVLVFLPGVGEIRTVERELTAALGPDGPAVLPFTAACRRLSRTPPSSPGPSAESFLRRTSPKPPSRSTALPPSSTAASNARLDSTPEPG